MRSGWPGTNLTVPYGAPPPPKKKIKKRSQVLHFGQPPTHQFKHHIETADIVDEVRLFYGCSYRFHLSGDNSRDRYIKGSCPNRSRSSRGRCTAPFQLEAQQRRSTRMIAALMAANSTLVLFKAC